MIENPDSPVEDQQQDSASSRASVSESSTPGKLIESPPLAGWPTSQNLSPGNYGRTISPFKTVLLIEDDSFVARQYGEWLEAVKFDVSYAQTVTEAFKQAADYRHFDFVVVDIRMPNGRFDAFESVMGFKTGLLLANELIQQLPDSIFIALSNSDRAEDIAWFEARNFEFRWKRDTSPKQFAEYLKRIAMKKKPRIFIVHGHDHKALLELKNYLQNVLHFDEPVILHEQASRGMTIIEKFEYYAKDAEIVFALLTPDDFGDSATGPGRARQNVLFEYGFFLGHLGRRSGKMFLLYKQGVDVPSDLSGIIRVDITNGVMTAGEQIRKELQDFLE